MILENLTMMDGVKISKGMLKKLNIKQQQLVLDIMGGKPYLVKDKILWIFGGFSFSKYPIIPWRGIGVSSAETEKELLEMSKKLLKVKKIK